MRLMSFIILFSCFNMWADQNQSGPSNAVNMANPILSGNVLLNPFKLDHQFLAQVFGTEICPGTSMAQADGTIANYFFPPAQDQQNVLAIRDPRRTLQDGDVIVFNSDPDATVYRRQYGIFSGEFPHAAIVQVRDGKILLVESPFPELEKAAPTSTEIQNVMNAKEALAQSQFISQLRSANAYPKEDIQAFIQLQEERRNHPRNGPPPTGPSGQNPTTKRSEGFRQG